MLGCFLGDRRLEEAGVLGQVEVVGLFVGQAGRSECLGPVRKHLTGGRGEGQRAAVGVEDSGGSLPLRPLSTDRFPESRLPRYGPVTKVVAADRSCGEWMKNTCWLGSVSLLQ